MRIESYATINPKTRTVIWTAEAWSGDCLVTQCTAATKADATRAASMAAAHYPKRHDMDNERKAA